MTASSESTSYLKKEHQTKYKDVQMNGELEHRTEQTVGQVGESDPKSVSIFLLPVYLKKNRFLLPEPAGTGCAAGGP